MRNRRGLGLGAGLALLAAAVYAFGFQRWVYGDGPQLIETFLFEKSLWMHVLYLPAACALSFVLGGSDPIDALRGASVLGGALGVLGTHLLARWFGASRWQAAFAALLAGAAPAIAFFSTTIEVHALHFGTVALAAWGVTQLPWRRFGVAVVLAALLVPLLYGTHKSAVLLGPGWLALACLARERATGERVGRKEVCVLGAALALAFLVSMRVAEGLVPGRNSIAETLQFIGVFEQPLSLDWLREAVLVGLGLLTPFALVGAFRTPRVERFVLGAFVLPVVVFFTWYGEATRGGYFASIVPFLAVLAANALPEVRGAGAPLLQHRASAALALAAVAAQVFLAVGEVREYQSGFSEEEGRARAAAVRGAIGEQGTLVSFEPTHQPVTLELPEVREVNVRSEFMKSAVAGMDPEVSARQTVLYLRKLLDENEGRFALDLGLGRRTSSARDYDRYLARIEEVVTDAFDQEVREDPLFPVIPLR